MVLFLGYVDVRSFGPSDGKALGGALILNLCLSRIVASGADLFSLRFLLSSRLLPLERRR